MANIHAFPRHMKITWISIFYMIRWCESLRRPPTELHYCFDSLSRKTIWMYNTHEWNYYIICMRCVWMDNLAVHKLIQFLIYSLITPGNSFNSLITSNGGKHINNDRYCFHIKHSSIVIFLSPSDWIHAFWNRFLSNNAQTNGTCVFFFMRFVLNLDVLRQTIVRQCL